MPPITFLSSEQVTVQRADTYAVLNPSHSVTQREQTQHFTTTLWKHPQNSEYCVSYLTHLSYPHLAIGGRSLGPAVVGHHAVNQCHCLLC